MNAKYRIVRIDGKSYYLHRVVWEAANGSIPIGHHIHHKDGNPRNNDLSNLELLSKAEHHGQHSREWHASATSEMKSEAARKGLPKRTSAFKCSHCGIDVVGVSNHKSTRRYCSTRCNSNAQYARTKEKAA